MRKHRKLTAYLCAAVLSLTAWSGKPGVHAEIIMPHIDPDVVLHYNTPAGTNFSGNAWDNDESFYKALPLGNGRIGAMVYGNCPTERFDLNEATFWSGGPGSNNKTVSADTMNYVWQQMLSGDFKGADGTINAQMIGGGMAKYQSVGTLNLDLGHSDVTDYSRTLDMNTAVAATSYTCGGKHYTRESFVSYPDQVLVTRITCDSAGNVSLSASYDCSLEGQFTISEDGSDTIVMNGHGDSGYGMPYTVWFSTRTKVIPSGGTVSAVNNHINVSGADSVLVLTSVRTNFVDFETCSGDEKGNAAADLAKAAKKDYDILFAAHYTDYAELFDRVALDLGGTESSSVPIPDRIAMFGQTNDPKLVKVLFMYGRYLMISASRDSEPMNLQGIWNKFRDPAWGCKYTTNINYEMNYWPALTTNLEECFRPFVEKAKSLQKQGSITAQEVYGVSEGWVVHHNTDLWNRTGPIDGAWGMWPTGGAWISDMLYDAYRFNCDDDYLKEVYPVMEGSAKFLSSIMRDAEIDGQTYSVVFPSTSPEVDTPASSGGKGAATSYGVTMDNAMTRALFSDVIETAEHLEGGSTFSALLHDKVNNIKPDTIGSWGQIQEWAFDWDAKDEHNRHISHMYDLFPGNVISKDSASQLAEAAAVSLNARGDEGTGWSEGWKLNCWARLEDAAHAYNIIKLMVSPVNNYGRLYDNLWDAHPPFQIDGNFGFTSGVAEMLLQSHDDCIKLLPALPEQWSTGFIDGLCARGGFTVGQEWENGALTAVTIYSKNGNICTLSYGGETITFPTDRGAVYKLNGDLEFVGQNVKTAKNVARNKTASSDGRNAAFAFDGANATQWTGGTTINSLVVDLGKEYPVCRWVVKLAGVSGTYTDNARAFTVELSKDGEAWYHADEIDGNTRNIRSYSFAPVDARYARLTIDNPSQKDSGAPIVSEFEVWGITDEPDPTRAPYTLTEAETFDRQSGIQTETLEDGGMDVGYIQNGDYIAFRRMDFGAGADGFSVQAGSDTDGGTVSLRLDAPDGKEVGTCSITNTGGWQTFREFSCDVTGATGIHTLYLVFGGDDGFLMNIDSFRFTTDNLRGDVNGDGTVALPDAVMMVKHLITEKPLTEAQALRADINGDGKINAADLTLLKRLLLTK